MPARELSALLHFTPFLAALAQLADLQNRMWNKIELKLNKLQIATFPHLACEEPVKCELWWIWAFATPGSLLGHRAACQRSVLPPTSDPRRGLSFNAESIFLGIIYLSMSVDKVLAIQKGSPRLDPLLSLSIFQCKFKDIFTFNLSAQLRRSIYCPCV